MAQTIKLKRSSVQGRVPGTSDLDLGEVAINTYDGKVYIKKDNGTASIIEVGQYATGSDGYIQYNNAGNTAGASFLYVDDSNNRLGIGTSTPSAALDVVGDIEINSTFTLNGEEATLATTTQTEIASFSATSYGGGKFVITAKDGSNRHICELLVTHDGTTAVATQYGSIYTSTELATYNVDISSGNVRILATSASTNSTVYKVAETLMEA